MALYPNGNSIREVFDAFNHIKVLVIGDSMIDTYISGTVDRMSPEAPVPILNVQEEAHRLGGAANVALNLQSLGAEVFLASIVGDDSNSDLFKNLLTDSGLSADYILNLEDRPTTQKKRVMTGSKHLLRMDHEVDLPISRQQSEKFFATIDHKIAEVNVVVVEDYDKGLLGEWLIDQVIQTASRSKVPVCVDPKFRNFKSYRGVDLLKPNLKEFHVAIGCRPENLESSVEQLRKEMEIGSLMLTMGAQGIFFCSDTYSKRHPVIERSISDVSGAGDTVIAIASLTYIMGLAPNIISELSNLGGGIVCQSPGVVPVSKSRLLEEAEKAGLI